MIFKITNKKLKIFFSVTALVFLAALILALAPLTVKSAFAEDVEISVFLPAKSEEYYALNSPVHAYSDGEVTAVTTDNRSLIIFNDGNFKSEVTSTTPLKQVTRFKDYLLYSDNQTVTAIKTDGTGGKIKLNYIDGNSEEKDLNCVFFSAMESGNEFILATITNKKLLIFTVADDLSVTLMDYFLQGGDVSVSDAPVSLNGNSVFYISNGKICRRDLSDLTVSVEYTSALPSDMIANEKFVYFIKDGKILRLDISNNLEDPVELEFTEDQYDLGKIINPSGLSFKGENLLITCNTLNGSVQEFEVSNTTAHFTGYAIASELSAYNRTAKDATEVHLFGDILAVKDGFKVSAISLDESYGLYDENRFNGYFLGAVPTITALGKDFIMFYDGKVKALSLKDGSEFTVLSPAYSVKALSYNSGYFYVTYPDGSKTTVVKISESDTSLTETKEYAGIPSTVAQTTDVFGNIYLADGYRIYKNGEVFADASVQKLASDLTGDIFALINGKIYRYNGEKADYTEVLSLTEKINSFGMDFINCKVYYTVENTEGIFYATGIGNASLSDAVPTFDLINFANGKKDLKLYALREGANAYSVTAENGDFIYNGLIDDPENVYPEIAEIEIRAGLKLKALASKKGTVLADVRELTDIAVNYKSQSEVYEKAFITTKVSAYALPITVKNDFFAIQSDGNTVKLEKGKELKINSEFTLLDVDFYDAEVEINGVLTPCYVPVAFTAPYLAQDFPFIDFSVETINSATVYSDEKLTQAIAKTEKGQKVKVIKTTDGYVQILLDINGIETICYISPRDLADRPANTVRNILIVLAIVASLAGTVSYFLLRRKD